MKVIIAVTALTFTMVAAVIAADFAAAAPSGEPGALPEDEDTVVELKWDNGTRSYSMAYYTGANAWVANDFDLRQLRDYTRITRMLVYTSPDWPNGAWDGFNIGLYSLSGGVPASLIWGPKFVKPGLSSAGWANFSVAWTLPPGTLRFAAAMEQFYNYPNADAHTLDNNPTFQEHSWMYSGSWTAYSSSTGYDNVMIRVRVSDAYVGMEPASMGRVKAMYR
ncbi:MAG: hypothetical protein PVH29_07345 [Candidatus Zixiibacteriota bacterium]|jgi:hypothetical protein